MEMYVVKTELTLHLTKYSYTYLQDSKISAHFAMS